MENKVVKAIVIMGIVTVLLLLFRFWLLFCVSLAALVFLVVLNGLINWKRTRQYSTLENHVTSCEEKSRVLSIAEQVTLFVKKEFPNAKWVWAQSDTYNRISSGDEVYIIMNAAAGYRRAKVDIDSETVTGITLCNSVKCVDKTETDEQTSDTSATLQTAVNYELVAFEWKDTHILELNEHINEAIGRGESEFIIEKESLPIYESWECVCEELKREGLEVECVENGIKIKIMQ